jgi:hypothetical protein
MSEHWDEFSKSLSEPVPRRESLRRLGAVFAGAVLSPLVLATAFGAKRRDPCIDFCKCRNKSQQSQCLAECRACNSDPRFLCGNCSGGYFCTDFANDPWNCGGCFNECGGAGPYEFPVCNNGLCEYRCESGAVRCNGTCTHIDWDQSNCGACGYDCGEAGPNEHFWCENGQCQSVCYEGADRCDGTCVFLDWDVENCGACGNVCNGSTPYCANGVCSACLPGLTPCGGSCVNMAYDSNNCGACGNVCGESTPYCSAGQCTDCAGIGGAICNGQCIDVLWDGNNCGACGNVCPPLTGCSFGVCHGSCIDC